MKAPKARTPGAFLNCLGVNNSSGSLPQAFLYSQAFRKEENMISILVTCDLNNPEQEYQKLIEAIKSTGDCCSCLKSTWLVRTRFTVEQVYNYLQQHLDNNDFILVVEVNPDNLRGWLSRKVCERD